MEHDIDDFNKALSESMLKHFGSLEKAVEYGNMLEKKNRKRQKAFIKKMKERQKEYDEQKRKILE